MSSRFLLPKINATLITGRSLLQGIGKESGKTSKKYLQNVAVCEIDPGDLKTLGLKERGNVRIKTSFGEVVVRAVPSRNAPHRGIVFIPYGPYANLLTPTDTESSGMPSFKGIEAEVEPTVDEPISDLQAILKKHYRR